MDRWAAETPEAEGYSAMVFALARCVFVVYFEPAGAIYGASALLYDEELGWGFVDEEAAAEIAFAHLYDLSDGSLFEPKRRLRLVQNKK